MNNDLMVVDNVRLEIGKEYFVKYKHCPSNWNKVKITRITNDGYPWQSGDNVNGIITDSYLVQEITPELELQQYAKKWLIDNAVINTEYTLPELLAKFYNSHKPNSITLQK